MKLYLTKKNVFIGWVLFLCVLISGFQASANGNFKLDDETLVRAEEKYGTDARKRLQVWENMIQSDRTGTDIEKLEQVNVFFNQLKFISDYDHWKRQDYWATPVEFIASNGGDCEDFSVAKYFTLMALGIPEKKLSLTYVKAVSLDQAHMVLTYYESPSDVPLVLDNLTTDVQPANKRADLLPIYSFNRTGVWVAKRMGRGEFVGKSDNLTLWNDLLERMPQGCI